MIAPLTAKRFEQHEPKTMKSPPPTKPPISASDITTALKRNGFPLEIRLLEALDKARLDPVIGHRFILGKEEQSIEVDLMGTINASLADNHGSVRFKLMIEAKQFDEQMAFVNLK